MNETYLGHTLHQKAKDAENKIKEKTYDMKEKVQLSISKTKYKLSRQKNRYVDDNYISIAIASFLVAVSLFTATSWLFYLGVGSILINAVLLIFTFIKN
ncbi:hypothetical protein [Oceanobacillus neutriphilus]|uniref:Uncharacterized protein n=1 Tax=Oceanobacillus neutriphilus TaxID=531815 RepID=A0ABQ2P3P9_9BACI|nr:hypothetical protein [Oceanobacillus neutriphilus]GGP16931.1 hypothetical protein GCM10011346_50860 [Oceanobacillus neutriphilus]